MNGNQYPFVVNKWVSVRCFGSFDEFDPSAGALPKAYTRLMVCQSTKSTLWPVGFESQRLFYDFTGAGVMRLYVCTVLVDREHDPPALKWRIRALDTTGEGVESYDPNEVMKLFKQHLEVINDNPIHNSWLSDAEHFFGINHNDVADIVHSLPHHNEILALLAPEVPLPQLKAQPVKLPTEPYVEPPDLALSRSRKRRVRNKRDSQRAAAAETATQQHDSDSSQKEEAAGAATVKEETTTKATAHNKHGGIDPISHFTFALPQVPYSAALKRLSEQGDAASSPEQAGLAETVLGATQALAESKAGLSFAGAAAKAAAEENESVADALALDELAKLQKTLARAERVILSLAETNHQLRMLGRLYAQRQAEEQASRLPLAPAALPEQPRD